jgi:signal recognition particle subunit SRP54
MSEMSQADEHGRGDVEKQMGRMRAIYDSMNKKERKNPGRLDGPRRRRIAAAPASTPTKSASS